MKIIPSLILRLILVIMALAAISLPTLAQSPNFNPNDKILGRPAVVLTGANATTNINSGLIQLRRGQNLSLQATQVATGANTTTPLFLFKFSNDGKTWTTANTTATAPALNGTTPVNFVIAVTVPAGTPRYAQLFRIDGGATANNTIISNVVVGIWDP